MSLRPKKDSTLSGWGRHASVDSTLYRPEKISDLPQIPGRVIARGAGRAYTDSALNSEGAVILTERLNRFLHFDATSGTLKAEPGVTLGEILDCFVPRGWFVPVLPGTKYVTLGGAVASDVHGKNHHIEGAFSSCVKELSLLIANGEVIQCSREKNPDLFRATIGGMGLTGIIQELSIQLHAIETAYMSVRYHAKRDWEELLSFFADPNSEDHYSVAWVDALSKGGSLGRGVVMTAHHASISELTSKNSDPLILGRERTGSVSPFLGRLLLHSPAVYLFNNLYYRFNSLRAESFFQDYRTYFFPLDGVENWNICYGKKGFIQYQFVVPEAAAEKVIHSIFAKMSAAQQRVYLAVMKRFGPQAEGVLSFPMKGITLAMDLPMSQELPALCQACDEIVVEAGGRVYLSKDAFLLPEPFRAMYPRLSEWKEIKNAVDPSWRFCSDLSRRLEMERG